MNGRGVRRLPHWCVGTLFNLVRVVSVCRQCSQYQSTTTRIQFHPVHDDSNAEDVSGDDQVFHQNGSSGGSLVRVVVLLIGSQRTDSATSSAMISTLVRFSPSLFS